LAESGSRAIGRDTSQGPGWWLASDGKWYPPELSPENRAKNKKRKKKAVKKKVASASAATGAGGPATTSTTEAEALDDRGPVLEPEDQIAARRIQAREQHLLLAGARQQAAARALSSLGVVDEPALVGVGGRSFDARTTAVDTQARAHGAPPLPPDEPTVTDDEPVVIDDEPEVAEADATTEAEALEDAPTSDNGTVATTATDETDADVAAEVDEVDGEPSIDLDDDAVDLDASPPEAPAEPDDAPVDESTPVESAIAAARDDAAPAPHQPTKRPEPGAAPMGTEMPFMEVRGSALGTDIDRIGEKILIFADRVELRDRGNTVKQTIDYAQLAGVTIQKKIMGPTLLVQSRTGATMTAKALRPETATGAKAMIEKHARRRLDATPGADVLVDTPTAAPPPPSDLELDFAGTDEAPALAPLDSTAASSPAPAATATMPAPSAPAADAVDAREPTLRRPHKHVLAAMIDELHAAGILDQSERDAKMALLDVLPPD
jgi:hypothetical protein